MALTPGGSLAFLLLLGYYVCHDDGAGVITAVVLAVAYVSSTGVIDSIYCIYFFNICLLRSHQS